MSLEELQEQWQKLDQRLQQSEAVQSDLAHRVVMQPARRRINRLAIWPAVDIVFCIGMLLLGVMFVSDHSRELSLLLPASVVIAAAVALMMESARQLRHVIELDWCGPVAEIQCGLERLRVSTIRQFKWIMLLAPLVGFSGLLCGLHWLLERLTEGRVEILNELPASWIAANYLFGVAFIPLGHFVARVLAEKCHHHPWWQAVLDGISGTSLKAAILDLKHWASLQQHALPERRPTAKNPSKN